MVSWTPLISAIGAIASLAAALFGGLNYWANRKSLKDAAVSERAKYWSMEAVRFPGGHHALRITYDQDAAPIRFVSIRGAGLRPPLLQGFTLMHVADPSGDPRRPRQTIVEPDPAGPRRIIRIDRDMNERTISGGTIAALVHLPRRPFWAQRGETRVKIAVTYEERNALRRRRRIIVNSPEIAWR